MSLLLCLLSHLAITKGALKAYTTGGEVEWIVLDPYDDYNGRHRIYMDKREYSEANNGSDVIGSDIIALQLLDIYDGPITYFDTDIYWNFYYIYTDTPLNPTGLSYVRSMNYGDWAIRGELTFAKFGMFFNAYCLSTEYKQWI